jgi:DNA-binding transcriptional ArsR family regulator
MKTDALTATFSALADPTRRAILEHLAEGEQTVTALAKPFVMSLPAISRHLKVLEEAGLITRSRDAQWRPCRLEPTPLRDIAGWVEQYRQMWDDRFDRLESYLANVQKNTPPTQKADHE